MITGIRRRAQLLLAALVLAAAGPALAQRPAADSAAPGPPPASLPDLQRQLERILRRNRVPGLALAMVTRDSVLWTGGLGVADVEKRTPVTARTIFRIGSVSKLFVGLEALALEAEGRLRLDAPVAQLVPDVAFTNPWERTDTLRLVHLLEHTSGWDDFALAEYAHNVDRPLRLAETLRLFPKTRTSRWRPGSFFSYSNAGPAVAAYAMERIEGDTFERIIARRFFEPLGMRTATYFRPPAGAPMTTLYHEDGRTPYPYWHIIYRPVGSINASAEDMAPLVRVLLNRGAHDGRALLPADAIARMEVPRTELARAAGLGTGYALANYASVYDGRAWRGHDGGVEGGLTTLAYLPEAGVGFALMINNESGEALEELTERVRAYLTRALPRVQPPRGVPLAPATADSLTGWYEPAAPRLERLRFVTRVAGLVHASVRGDTLMLREGFDSTFHYLALDGRRFREAADTQATLVAFEAAPYGRLLVGHGGTHSPGALRRIPAWMAWARLGGAVAFNLAFLAILPVALWWAILRLRGRLVGPALPRLLPAGAALAVLAVVALVEGASANLLVSLGRPTGWSVGLMVATLVFAACSVGGLVATLRAGAALRPATRVFLLAVAGIFTVVTLFLGWHGVIGLRTWS